MIKKKNQIKNETTPHRHLDFPFGRVERVLCPLSGWKSNEKYVNPKKGFESYFISFGEGPSLELMSRPDVQNTVVEENRVGLTHLAFTFPGREEVLRFTEEMRSEGYTIAGEPRTSGDGYFESVILDPDGNRIECVYKKEYGEED